MSHTSHLTFDSDQITLNVNTKETLEIEIIKLFAATKTIIYNET